MAVLSSGNSGCCGAMHRSGATDGAPAQLSTDTGRSAACVQAAGLRAS